MLTRLSTIIFMLATIICCNTAFAEQVKIATYNVTLSQKGPGILAKKLHKGTGNQLSEIIQTIQTVRPDILFLNAFDFDLDQISLNLFQSILKSSDTIQKIDYPYSFSAPVNSGELTAFDMDDDQKIIYGKDTYSHGSFKGYEGMAILSKYPIETQHIRTFSKLLWQDLPQHNQPLLDNDEINKMRLSTKSHWDIPIILPSNQTIHIYASHPTAPIFDGVEDLNGWRNHDEIMFWEQYINGYIVTDDRMLTAPKRDNLFIILGSLNQDPIDGEGRKSAINQLLSHVEIQDPLPQSLGAIYASNARPKLNHSHKGLPRFDTSHWVKDYHPGNLRVDYALPSTEFKILNAAVEWPINNHKKTQKILNDHKMVWVTLGLPDPH